MSNFNIDHLITQALRNGAMSEEGSGNHAAAAAMSMQALSWESRALDVPELHSQYRPRKKALDPHH